MAITEYEVDPSIAGASGAGTHADPYGDLQHALDTITRDATNGDRISIWNTTDEILAAAISLATYGSPTTGAPLVIQGMTSTGVPGDGGIGGISGNAAVAIIDSTTLDGIHLIDLHLHNVPSLANPLRLDNNCSIINCEINNMTATSATVSLGASAVVMNNYIHDNGARGVQIESGSVIGNRFADGTKTMSAHHIQHNSSTQPLHVQGNTLFMASHSGTGISVFTNSVVAHNSIYSDGGSGTGIEGSITLARSAIVNNLIEGFSSVGGIGIDFTGRGVMYADGNAVFDCVTEYVLASIIMKGDTTNRILTVSPFTDAANEDFTPVNTDTIFNTALPDKIGLF
jgi:hypothetical protein